MSDLKPMMPRYEAYKDSGGKWLGEIPEHWNLIEVKRLLFDGKKGIRIGPFGSSLKSDLFVESGYKVYGQEHVIAKNFSVGQKYIGKKDFRRLAKYQIFPNDIVVTMMGTTGKCQVVPRIIEPGLMDSHLIRLKVKVSCILPYFFQILVNDSHYTHVQIKINSKGSIMDGLNSSIIKSLILILPSISEQTTIANFLDYKTQKIDQAIAIKEKQIHLLKERKQILIQEAVTKGLDPNVPMRDSGVAWIGEIPGHWTVKRFKYLFVQSNLPTRSSDEVVTSYRDGQVTLRSNRRLAGYTEAILEQGYQGIRKGQLVLNSMDAFEGAIGVSDSDGKCTPEYVICDPVSDELLPDYFAYLLREMALSKYIRVICNAVRQRAVRIRFNNLKKRFFIVPPIEEQKVIVAHIQTQSEKIDNAITIQQQMIEKLKEYKTTLINSAVTGKIKVPEPENPKEVA